MFLGKLFFKIKSAEISPKKSVNMYQRSNPAVGAAVDFIWRAWRSLPGFFRGILDGYSANQQEGKIASLKSLHEGSAHSMFWQWDVSEPRMLCSEAAAALSLELTLTVR